MAEALRLIDLGGGVLTAKEAWLVENPSPVDQVRERHAEMREYFRELVEYYDKQIVRIASLARESNELAILLEPQIFESTADTIESEFTALAVSWLNETGHLSDPLRKFMHRSHLRIIGMGEKVLPYILREVEKRSGHWFVALDAISPENPVKPEDSVSLDRTSQAWVEWGRRQGLI